MMGMMFDRADGDKDGKLSEKEFLAAVERIQAMRAGRGAGGPGRPAGAGGEGKPKKDGND